MQRSNARKLPVSLGVACLALGSLSAHAAMTLSVPASKEPLHLAVALPEGWSSEGTSTDQPLAWQWVEQGGDSVVAPAELVPAIGSDGRPAPTRWEMLTTIPPAQKAQGGRTFALESRPAGKPSQAWTGLHWANFGEKSVKLWEGTRPVLMYNFDTLLPPGVPKDRRRSTYVHPLWGLDGEVLSDDFPKDHYHHRGLFWTWPHVMVDGEHYDLWTIKGVWQRFERWLGRQAGPAGAVLGVENGWYTAADKKIMQERVWLRVYPTSGDAQVVDVDLTLIPTDRPVTLRGAEGKSYGGLTLRFAPRQQTVITTPLGNAPRDLTTTPLAWADLSALFRGAKGPSGAAIFIPPNHPDYPPTWLTRHYGALCVGWPGVKGRTFPRGQPVRLQYRVWIHRGMASRARLEAAYTAYCAGMKVRLH